MARARVAGHRVRLTDGVLEAKLENFGTFYFIRWIVPGQEPRGSQTFATLRACVAYVRRAMYAHPTWRYQIVRQQDGEQTVVREG